MHKWVCGWVHTCLCVKVIVCTCMHKWVCGWVHTCLCVKVIVCAVKVNDDEDPISVRDVFIQWLSSVLKETVFGEY